MGPKPRNEIDNRYGRLVVIQYLHRNSKQRFYLCKCDCGKETIARIDQLRSGHTRSCGCLIADTRNPFHPPPEWWQGERNPKWNGGKYITANNIVCIRQPDHPNADKRGYVREHRLIMSNHIGRPIKRNEVVHHINCDTSDNRLENLQLMTRSQHHSFHHKGLIKPNSLLNLKYHQKIKKILNV